MTNDKLSGLWILVNVGCIECGVDSNIVGVFDKDRAEELAEILNEDNRSSWRGGGQNYYETFPMPPIGEMHPEYTAFLKSEDNSDDE